MSIIYGNREYMAEEWANREPDNEILHPDGSDCDYCTYDKPCVAIVNTLPAPLKNMVPNNT